MAGCGGGGLRFGRRTLGPRQVGLIFGFESHCGGVPRFRFLFGTPAGFARCLFFRRHARQGCGLGDLLGANFFARQIGRAPFGFGPLASQTSNFFFFPGAGSSGDRQLGGGEFTALGIRQGALFGLDSRAQGNLCQSFDMRLLRRGGLRRCFGGRAAESVFRGKIFGLQAPLRSGNVLGRQQLTRLGGGARALVRTGTGQGVRLGGALGVRRIGGSRSAAGGALLALPLDIHQSRQDFAQALAPGCGQEFKRPVAIA